MNVDQAVSFVESSGTAAQVALAHSAVGRIGADDAVEAVAAHQRADGSWAKIDPDMSGDLSSISQTWIGLQWLIWLSPAGADQLEHTIAFLRGAQRRQGFWDEPDEIAQFSPPQWMLPGQRDNQVWLTSAVCCKLKELDRSADVSYEAALEFLRGAWSDENRRFSDDPHPHWMALPLFHNSIDPRDALIEAGCRERLVEAIENSRLDPSDYTAVAYAAMLGSDVELFRRCLDKIESYQQADGGMTTRYGDQHRPNATVETLFLFKCANLLPVASKTES